MELMGERTLDQTDRRTTRSGARSILSVLQYAPGDALNEYYDPVALLSRSQYFFIVS